MQRNGGRTLKSLPWKHAVKLRNHNQWDNYLSGVLWAYRNTHHEESTGEKPSFLLFGVDCRTPTEATLLPPNPVEPIETDDYWEELIQNLSSARELAEVLAWVSKQRYDSKTTSRPYRVGEWVLIWFPKEETGCNRKLSQPWHGQFRVVSCDDPDLTVVKVYHPQDGQVQIHQMQVMLWPRNIVSGYFWYGRKKHSPGNPPQWLSELSLRLVLKLRMTAQSSSHKSTEAEESDPAEQQSGVNGDAGQPLESRHDRFSLQDRPNNSCSQLGMRLLRWGGYVTNWILNY